MKKFFFLFVLLIILACNQLQAQNYTSAVGARLGSPISLSYKMFISDQNALEGYIGFRDNASYNWFSISGAYLVHRPLEIEGIEGLDWYFGGGGSVFFWSYPNGTVDNYSTTTLGIQGYLGLEYTLSNIPLNFTIDWIPTIFIGNNLFVNSFGGGYGSVGVRYVLNSN
ncbi:MAG: hypothetical protein HC892_16145 [Saprospiraceae bacterium]|nr:hypothetical protein [Saprospiraceae bacterium]